MAGPVRVDVIYRRIDDDFLDPEAFRPDSLLGVPGLMRAYRKGKVALANAIGTGVADDKAVYAYMPRLIRYYLDEEPILDNVETRICREPEALRLHAGPSGRAGGQAGRRVGRLRHHDRPAREQGRARACRASGCWPIPANYISQPMIELSVSPTLVDGRHRAAPRRPAAVRGHRPTTWVLPGGLTRVALQAGSLVVNSSQGGGSKDTWVLAERAA